MMLTIIGVIIGVLIVALIVRSLCRAAAVGDREARRAFQDYLMRYQGGERPCVKCGKPSPYSLRGEPIHPECREDDAA